LRSGFSFLLKTPGKADHPARFEGANMDLGLRWDPLVVGVRGVWEMTGGIEAGKRELSQEF
jgi:hypothetical protein